MQGIVDRKANELFLENAFRLFLFVIPEGNLLLLSPILNTNLESALVSRLFRPSVPSLKFVENEVSS